MSDVVIKTTISCDACGKIDELEVFNGQSNFRLPVGWVTVRPSALFHRFNELPKEKHIGKREVNEVVSRLVPNLHFCLECVTDQEKRLKEKLENDQRVQAEIDRTIGFRINRRQIMTEGRVDG